VIVTVTPAPAIDWTIRLEAFEWEAVNRSAESTREASGKGINVSVALAAAGVQTLAVFPGGGSSGAFLAAELERLGVPFRLAEVVPEVRTNITLVTPGRAGTKVNESGAVLDASALQRFTAVVTDALPAGGAGGAGTGAGVGADAGTGVAGAGTGGADAAADVARTDTAAADVADAVLGCGSLPPGMPASYYRDLVAEASARGLFTVVDTSGESFTLALEAGPSLVKPNVHELAEFTGRRLVTVGDVVEAAHELRSRGAGAVLASLGADGVVYVDAAHELYGVGGPVEVVNTVGAGDALLAGFVGGRARGLDVAGCLSTALAWAGAAVGTRSTHFAIPDAAATAAATITAVPAERALREPSQPLA